MTQRELKKWLAERGARSQEAVILTMLTELIELRRRVAELESQKSGLQFLKRGKRK